jgi:hypothetical protein
MRKQYEDIREPRSEQKPIEGLGSQLLIVASVRTGLAGKNNAILRRVPVDYSEKTIREAIDYIVASDLSDSELPLSESVKKELGERGSVVVVNGKTARLDDRVDKYLVMKEHKLPDESKKQYRELEIEVSAVQQGGIYRLIR